MHKKFNKLKLLHAKTIYDFYLPNVCLVNDVSGYNPVQSRTISAAYN